MREQGAGVVHRVWMRVEKEEKGSNHTRGVRRSSQPWTDGGTGFAANSISESLTSGVGEAATLSGKTVK